MTDKKIVVHIPDEARQKLWVWLLANNTNLGVQRDPNDRWISNSSILEETETDLLVEQGWERIPGSPTARDLDHGEHQTLRHLVLKGEGRFVFDMLELVARYMEPAAQEKLRQKINQIFELHECPWRLSDREFFKLDADFVGARLASTAHEALTSNNFAGAADEYGKARQYLGAGDVREAIYFAGHSLESVMKVLTGSGSEHANADKLIKMLLEKGFLDDLPETVREGFAGQVLKALPFMRNKLGGHGQGAQVITIPQSYGELAVQLAAAFHNFFITKLLKTAPRPLPITSSAIVQPDDDIPF